MSKVSKEDLARLQELAGIYTDVLNEKDAGDSSNPKLAVGHVDNERDMIRTLPNGKIYCRTSKNVKRSTRFRFPKLVAV
jgi:hypothetical protein